MTQLLENSDPLIRRATLADLDALTAMDALCFPAGIAYPREEIAFLLRASAILTIVAEKFGTTAGFAALQRRRSPGEGRYGELVTIEVLPEFRRQSIAFRLHQWLEQSLRQWGGRCIQLHVSVENAAAVEFYRRLGYQVIARFSRYYLNTTDAWQMEKTFV